MSPMTSHPLSLELALLGYLHPSPLHGYQIHQRLLEPDGPGLVWRIKQAQLYAHLGKLEENGLIRGTLQAQETRPTRRVFQLTKEGQDTFDEWLTSAVSTPRQMRQEFMVKLYFARRESEQAVSTLIDNQLSACQGWLEGHHQQLATASDGSFSRIVHQYRLGQIQAAFAWLQQMKAEMPVKAV